MCGIEALPREILSNVASFLERDRASLCALALVSHDFAFSSLPILVRHIDFAIRADDHSFSEPFELFMRSLRENRKIALNVQTARLGWSTGRSTTGGNGKAYSRANDLLRILPNIHTLSLKILGPVPTAFDHDFLDTNPLPRLRELELLDHNATATHVAKYLTLTPVQRMKVHYLNVHAPLNPSFLSNPSPRISNLSNLTLTHFHLPAITMSEILRFPKALQTLHCAISREERPGFHYRKSMRGNFSPATTARALEPIKDTLVELRLGDGTLTAWPRHDESKLDLSEFTALRILRTASSCFFPFPTARGREREGLWRFLPIHIEEVYVRRHQRLLHARLRSNEY